MNDVHATAVRTAEINARNNRNLDRWFARSAWHSHTTDWLLDPRDDELRRRWLHRKITQLIPATKHSPAFFLRDGEFVGNARA